MRRVGSLVWISGAAWLTGCLLVSSLAGCFAEDPPPVSPRLVETVEVTRIEPGTACQALGAVEGRSTDDDDTYQSAFQAVREHAALLGGNYVVIDAVSGPTLALDGVYDSSVVIRGRLYGCALGVPWSPARVPAPQPWSAQSPECGGQ